MGTKQKLAKKKGPKGKKARAKAKLERQWGEVADEEQLAESRRIRRGKSHRKDKRRAEENDIDWQQQTQMKEMEQKSASDESDEDVDPNESLSRLLHSIQKKSGKTKRKETKRRYREEEMILRAEEDSNLKVEMVQDGDEGSSDSEDVVLDNAEDEEESDEEFDKSEDDGDMMGDSLDPFASHFNRTSDKDEELAKLVAAAQVTQKVPVPFLSESLDIQLSTTVQPTTKGNKSTSVLNQMWSEAAQPFFSCNRKVLKQGWRRTNVSVSRSNPDGVEERNTVSDKKKRLSSLQCVLYPSLASYADLLITAESRENRDSIRNLLCLHILNHVLTSRARIQRNNKKAKEAAEMTEEEVDTEKLRDQGFTRPTVLILMPTRGTCYSFIKCIMALLGDAAREDNMDRFETEYGPPVTEDDKDMDQDKERHRRKVVESKGPEWQELFGDGTNCDDDFKIGITITPKTASRKGQGNVSVKLYSDFYRSDIIIASPLGLKMTTESENGDADIDFLSSIEICLVAHASVLLMQNWDHVNAVLDLLNKQPTKNNDTDFSRVRNYLLAGQAQHWRQLIVTSVLSDAHIVSTFKRYAKSIAGRLKLRRRTPLEDASLCNVMVPVKQVFQRIPCKSFATQGSDRLRFFEDRILPQVKKQKHTMLFIPDYFDFVSVRNLLLKKDVEFVSVTEYARVSEVSRGRARFLQGIKPLLLYTGRAHFFSRHTIKGVRHLILFGLPEHSEFYSELVNMLNAGLDHDSDDTDLSPTSCLSLFTKFDALALDRIVGSEHCSRMIKGEKSSYMFCS